MYMKVTIVIPNYNGKHFMEPCLASLERQTCHDFKILVVDNASTDGSLEYMKENYPDIEVIALDKNYGFSKAVNVGIRHSRTPYVILLNNDTTVDPHYVEEMVGAIERSPRIFSVSSKMIQMYHPDLIDSAGDLYTVIGWGICRGTGRPVTNYTKADEIFTACAGAAIYRRSDILMRAILPIWKISMWATAPRSMAIKTCIARPRWSTMWEAEQAAPSIIPSR